MFFLTRYLPLGRSVPETTDQGSDIGATSPVRQRQGIEMTVVGRRTVGGTDSPRFEDISPVGTANEESFEDFYEEEGPSAAAVVAVRLCVWAFFLFGFMILLQNQQQKFSSDRQSSRLRSPQLIHMQVPWMDFSGFRDHSTNFIGHFIETNSTTFSIAKLNAGAVSLTCRRLGSSPIIFEKNQNDDLVHAVQPLSNGQFVRVSETNGHFTFPYQSVQYVFANSVNYDLRFFQLVSTENTLVAVLQKKLSNTHDCLAKFALEAGVSRCITSEPIVRASGYFFDEQFGNLISVGPDTVSSDAQGYSMNGVFVRSVHVNNSSVELSVTVPFINRYGLWAFQNNPLSQGFVVLVPTIGFPAQPVQHLVAVRSGIAEKGSTFRLESLDVALFRKIETLKFLPPKLDSTLCSCTSIT